MGVHVLDAIIRDWFEPPPQHPPFSLEGPRRRRTEFWFGIALAALFLCVAAPPRSMLFGASWASLGSVRHTNTAPFPLRALEEEEPSFGSKSRRPLYFCASQLLHAVRFLALLEQALAASDINSSATGTIAVSRCGFDFGIAFLCRACPCHPSLSPCQRLLPSLSVTGLLMYKRNSGGHLLFVCLL